MKREERASLEYRVKDVQERVAVLVSDRAQLQSSAIKLVADVDLQLQHYAVLLRDLKDELAARDSGEKKGRWVEPKITEDGMYATSNDRIMHWTCAPTNYGEGIFGGWLWEHDGQTHWDTERCGVENGRISSDPKRWEFPLTPKKVRFWAED